MTLVSSVTCLISTQWGRVSNTFCWKWMPDGVQRTLGVIGHSPFSIGASRVGDLTRRAINSFFRRAFLLTSNRTFPSARRTSPPTLSMVAHANESAISGFFFISTESTWQMECDRLLGITIFWNIHVFYSHVTFNMFKAQSHELFVILMHFSALCSLFHLSGKAKHLYQWSRFMRHNSKLFKTP